MDIATPVLNRRFHFFTWSVHSQQRWHPLLWITTPVMKFATGLEGYLIHNFVFPNYLCFYRGLCNICCWAKLSKQQEKQILWLKPRGDRKALSRPCLPRLMSILFSRRICSSTTEQPEFPGNNPPCWKPNGCVSGHSSPSLVSGSSQTFWRRRKNSKNITTWADDHGDQGGKPPKWLCNCSIGLLLWADPHWPQEQCCWHGLIAQWPGEHAPKWLCKRSP